LSRVDERKEEIGALKTYLGFIVAFIITIGAGISKLYLDNEHGYLFLIGIIAIMVFSFIFAFIAKNMYKKIKSLKDLN